MTVFSNPTPFEPGTRMIDASLLNTLLANSIGSTADGLTATPVGTQVNAVSAAQAINRVTTVASATDAVGLPPAVAGAVIVLINDGANAMQVFGRAGDTINDVATATGVPQGAGTTVAYYCSTGGKWYAQGGTSSGTVTNLTVSGTLAVTGTTTLGAVNESNNLTFTAIGKSIVQKRGVNGKVGTFVANGATPVTVANTSIAITDAIIISLNTVGGTVGAVPAIQTITAATGFTVAATASDTSTYNYSIISSAT